MKQLLVFACFVAVIKACTAMAPKPAPKPEPLTRYDMEDAVEDAIDRRELERLWEDE